VNFCTGDKPEDRKGSGVGVVVTYVVWNQFIGAAGIMQPESYRTVSY
jgi:hypothetical protein